MKKLIVTITIVLSAIVASAASFDWKTSATGKIYGAGTTTLLASGTAYIFNSGVNSQDSVLAAFLGGTDWTTGALDNKALANGAIAATNGEAFNWGTAGNTLNAFFAVVDGDKISISDIVSKDAAETGYSQFSFNAKATSQAAALDSSSFSGAGWYQSVPEPTSGLLMLLGMAGLALRRRRA